MERRKGGDIEHYECFGQVSRASAFLWPSHLVITAGLQTPDNAPLPLHACHPLCIGQFGSPKSIKSLISPTSQAPGIASLSGQSAS